GSNGTFAVIGQVANGLSYLDSGLSAGTQYFYRVRVPNYFADSDYSNEANATPVAGQMSVPLSDPNLVLWDAGTGHRSVGAVDSWQNRANPAQYATQSSVSSQPQFVTNGLNGLPVMRFDGANDSFALPNVLSGATQAEAFVVLKATNDLPSSPHG